MDGCQKYHFQDACGEIKASHHPFPNAGDLPGAAPFSILCSALANAVSWALL